MDHIIGGGTDNSLISKILSEPHRNKPSRISSSSEYWREKKENIEFIFVQQFLFKSRADQWDDW